jgi:uncharacterized protein (TIGR02453 family)
MEKKENDHMLNENCNYFKGFSIATIDFLRNLYQNNNKTWFEDNKESYKKFLLAPMQALVMEMNNYILSIDPSIDVTPSAGKTISRIHRDTRFSKDKSPYRDTMWITFKRPSENWSSNPAFFFEISPSSYRYGMGFFSATPHTMELFREAIDNSPAEFKKAIAFYPKQQVFTIEGEKYKRILDKNKAEDILEWYQRKNLYLVCNKTIDTVLFSDQLVHELKSNFSLISDFYLYLYKIQK